MNYHLDNNDIEYVIDEISEVIKGNLKALSISDNELLSLKKYCNKKKEHSFIATDSLIELTEDAIIALSKVDKLYDFRDIL